MPFYDRACPDCTWTAIDRFERIEPGIVLCPDCGSPTERAWLTKPSNVVGDEMEHTQVNGLAQPRRFTSKIEHRRWLKANIYRIADDHVPLQGSDRSPHSSRWAAISQETLDGAKAMLERSSGAGSRDASKAEIGITSFDGLIHYLTTKRKAEAGQFF